MEFTEVLDNIEGLLLSSGVISDIIPGLTILVILILTNKTSVYHQLVSKVAAQFQDFQLLFQSDDAQVFKKVLMNLRGVTETIQHGDDSRSQDQDTERRICSVRSIR